MHEKRGKILGTILFLVLISCLLYLTFSSNRKKTNGEISMIQITGNKLLSSNDYKIFAHLNEPTEYKNLTLPVIKDRMLKHPYVKNADVENAGNGLVKIEIEEKSIQAVLLTKNEPKFITKNFEVLPLLSNSKFQDLTVISNPHIEKEVTSLNVLKNDDLVEAFKIIDAAELANKDLLKHLSEINLRDGGDIILSFSGVKPPVIFGRGEAAKKMVYLDIMWQSMSDQNNLMDESEYIDLRFANEIFLGSVEKTGLSE